VKQRGWPRKLDDAQAARVRAWYGQIARPPAGTVAQELGVDRSLLYRIGKGLAYKRCARG
jgi:hypothetical protein